MFVTELARGQMHFHTAAKSHHLHRGETVPNPSERTTHELTTELSNAEDPAEFSEQLAPLNGSDRIVTGR
jgi:hypothetical protein